MVSRIPLDLPAVCPYSDCPGLSHRSVLSPRFSQLVRRGFYRRKEDSKWIRRYRCLRCRRSFSSSRWSACFGQKKRRKNIWVARFHSNSVSQRGMARLLRINRKTVVRKLLFLQKQAKQERLARLESYATEGQEHRLRSIQWDEMESFEHSKCLPLSIPLVVDAQTRRILSFRVGRMPAKGLLAEISRKKYGPRADDRARLVKEMLREIRPALHPEVEVLTDQNPRYPGWMKKHLPQARHRTTKGQRGCVVGQGELKALIFDPLFALNHSCAMLRAHVNRLFRRTWCTTKRRDRLEAHLELYVQAHNRRIDEIEAKKRASV